MLDSYATQSQISTLQTQIAALQAQIAATGVQVVVGGNQPTTAQQGYAWARTVNGYYDATYFYVNNNWYTPMPYVIGQTTLIRVGSALQIGFSPATDSSLLPVAGFNWYEFTGANLYISGQIAYRQFGQPLISGTLA